MPSDSGRRPGCLHQVAASDGESIGSVVRRGRLWQAEQARNHALHLALRGGAGAAHRFLHRLRRVVEAGNRVPGGGQQGHAAGLTHAQRRAYVLSEEEVLERHRIGLVPADQLSERLVQPAEPLLDTQVGRGLDHPAVERHHPLPGRANHTEPGVGDTRIDADDDHPPSFSDSGRMSFKSGCRCGPLEDLLRHVEVGMH